MSLGISTLGVISSSSSQKFPDGYVAEETEIAVECDDLTVDVEVEE